VLVDPEGLDVLGVGVGGYVVAGEIVVDQSADTGVNDPVFEEGHRQPHGHASS
jgi:hypothetical protein